MVGTNNTVKTPIVNKNGVATHVHKKADPTTPAGSSRVGAIKDAPLHPADQFMLDNFPEQKAFLDSHFIDRFGENVSVELTEQEANMVSPVDDIGINITVNDSKVEFTLTAEGVDFAESYLGAFGGIDSFEKREITEAISEKASLINERLSELGIESTLNDGGTFSLRRKVDFTSTKSFDFSQVTWSSVSWKVNSNDEFLDFCNFVGNPTEGNPVVRMLNDVLDR